MTNLSSDYESKVNWDLIKDNKFRCPPEIVNEESNCISESICEQRNTCKKCGGSGILDFEFYTRKCECCLK